MPSIPVAVGEIVRLAMAKQPSARFQSASGMLAALEKLLHEDTSPLKLPGDSPIAAKTAMILGTAKRNDWVEHPTRLARTGLSRRLWLLAALGAALAVVAVGNWFGTQPVRQPETPTAVVGDSIELFNGKDLAG